MGATSIVPAALVTDSVGAGSTFVGASFAVTTGGSVVTGSAFAEVSFGVMTGGTGGAIAATAFSGKGVVLVSGNLIDAGAFTVARPLPDGFTGMPSKPTRSGSVVGLTVGAVSTDGFAAAGFSIVRTVMVGVGSLSLVSPGAFAVIT